MLESQSQQTRNLQPKQTPIKTMSQVTKLMQPNVSYDFGGTAKTSIKLTDRPAKWKKMSVSNKTMWNHTVWPFTIFHKHDEHENKLRTNTHISKIKTHTKTSHILTTCCIHKFLLSRCKLNHQILICVLKRFQLLCFKLSFGILPNFFFKILCVAPIKIQMKYK